ncbi:MAG: hypothetical protein KA234_06795, partial [Saprospiraceae bacterium]|nr:hypothetical protein [Saprospiraceae bacterium]
MLFRVIVFSMFFGYFACAPKVATVVKTEEPTKTDTIPVKQGPVSPCATFADLSGYDRERAETAFVLYKDFMKLNKYDEALKHWKLAYSLAPGSNGRVKYHFEDGANIYKKLFESATDSIQKQRYVDTIMMIYDKKKECFGDEAYINGLKGFDYYYYYQQYTTMDNIFGLLKSNFDVKGKNADYFVINPFTKMVYDRVVDGRLNIEDGRKYADLIFKAIENGKATCKGKACESWEVIDEYAPVRLEALEGIDNFYDCNYY